MRGTGRTRLFRELRSLLPGKFGDQKCAFFEDPFGQLPHPLLWVQEEHELDPVSRLFELWKRLNEFNVKKLRPALQSHDIVVVDGYGLNALLYATAYGGDTQEAEEGAVHMHHHIVRARVIAQGIRPPEYLITRADCDTVTKYLKRTVHSLDTAKCHAFIKKEEVIIQEYFKPSTGQQGHMLDASLSLEAMSEIALSIICGRVEELRRAA